MTELIAFVFGLGLGLHYGPPLRQWALSKLKPAEPQPVMGGPIQPDGEGWAFAVGETVEIIASGATGTVDAREILSGVRCYLVNGYWLGEADLRAV